MLENEKPISAYDINSVIKSRGKNLNISSVYRVIEFWVKLKVIHKISLLNKYMLCDNTDEKHTHITNICTSCLSVIETCNESMGLDLIKSSKKLVANCVGFFNTPNFTGIILRLPPRIMSKSIDCPGEIDPMIRIMLFEESTGEPATFKMISPTSKPAL